MSSTTKPFMRALADALRTNDNPAVDPDDGSINYSVFARTLPTIHYETLRKIKSGDRALDKSAIEEIAHAAGVEPTYFAEYRLMLAQELFDPRIAGFDAAVENLNRYLTEARGRQARKA